MNTLAPEGPEQRDLRPMHLTSHRGPASYQACPQVQAGSTPGWLPSWRRSLGERQPPHLSRVRCSRGPNQTREREVRACLPVGANCRAQPPSCPGQHGDKSPLSSGKVLPRRAGALDAQDGPRPLCGYDVCMSVTDPRSVSSCTEQLQLTPGKPGPGSVGNEAPNKMLLGGLPDWLPRH